PYTTLFRSAAHLVATTPALARRTLWLASSQRMAQALAEALHSSSASVDVFAAEGVFGVSHTPDEELYSRAKTFLQNIGGYLSSREAESLQVERGLLPSFTPEPMFEGDAAAEVRRVLHRALPGVRDADLLLASSRMNAIYAAFRASDGLQAVRGRTVWLQLGWIYLDTIAILKKSTATPADYVYVRDPLDRDA